MHVVEETSFGGFNHTAWCEFLADDAHEEAVVVNSVHCCVGPAEFVGPATGEGIESDAVFWSVFVSSEGELGESEGDGAAGGDSGSGWSGFVDHGTEEERVQCEGGFQ